MANWYDSYLEAYEKDWRTLPHSTLDGLKEKLAQMRCEKPRATVVAIAHNEEKHLVSCLQSLVNNKADFPFEIIVVNNNSTDTTLELLNNLGATHYNEPKPGPGHARNCGLDNARGEYHICCDSDTIYPPTYIQTMVDTLRKPGTACAYGLWSFLPDAAHSPVGLWLYETIRDIYLRLQQVKRPELNVRGMAFAFPTALGRQYRFRTDIIRGEDGSLALEMKKNGALRLITSRKARPITGHGTVSKDGGLTGMFIARAKKAIGTMSHLFTKKEKYEDEESNLIPTK